MSQGKVSRPVVLPEISAEALRDILDSSPDGVCVVVPGPWRLVYANRTMLSWLDTGSQPWQDRPLADLVPALSSADILEQLDGVLRGDANEVALTAPLTPTGAEPMEIRLRRVVIGSQPAVAITAHGAVVSPLPPGSDVDSLTGLASRSFLLSRLDELLRGDRATDGQIAVLFIDLNEFKWVNDTYGHLVGDRALCEVAHRLATCVRGGDHIVRFGGDEFVVLLEQVGDEKDVQPVLDRIHAVLQQPISLPAGEVTLTASIGVAEASPAHRTAEDLLAAADLAMYASKRG
jgi:diguanylate cyclase (GGDEF)-like protein